MNEGILEINFTVLKQILRLPQDAMLLKVRQSWEQEKRGVFEVLVSAPNLQETLPGDALPWVRCRINTEFCKQDEIVHIVGSTIENH